MDTKRKLAVIVSCLMTVALTVALLNYSFKVMERKTSDTKYAPFFEQEQDFDVLFMGTSHVINGIFPMELWNDYGIISYNFGGHSNQLATTYWVMENALDYTAPSLMVVDCFVLSGNSKISSNFSYVHQSLDAFPISLTKGKAALDLIEDETEGTIIELLWNYSVYHDRWNELTKSDFEFSATKQKGASSRIAVGKPNEVTKIPAESKLEEDTVGTVYLEKIIADCQERGIEVLLTYLPFPAGEKSQMEANRVYDIAKRYGVNYINFLDMNIVNYETDCYDESSHLNPSGAKKVTDYLGQYIMEHYNIPDQRMNEEYNSWYADYEEYNAYKITQMKNQKSLDIYLMLLADKNYSAVVEITNPEIWKSRYYTRLFENLGVNRDEITDATDLLVIQEGGKHVDYIENFFNSENGCMTSFGEINLTPGTDGGYDVYLDDRKLYTVTQKHAADAGIRIMAADKDMAEMIDKVSFSIQGKKDIPEEEITIKEAEHAF